MVSHPSKQHACSLSESLITNFGLSDPTLEHYIRYITGIKQQHVIKYIIILPVIFLV